MIVQLDNIKQDMMKQTEIGSKTESINFPQGLQFFLLRKIILINMNLPIYQMLHELVISRFL